MKKKVMICDDNEDILEVSKVILSMKGYEVQTVTNSDELFPAIEKQAPEVILMDLGIPEIGGAAATKQLKSNEKTKNIPVLIFSANPDIEKIAAQCGANGFLSKPFEIDMLEKAIENAI
jgi:two-component system, OmpR family, alkaline phosphatase synthesis response regulator PhoP